MARKKINILFMDRKGKGYVGAANTRYEFEQAVRKYARCMFAGEGWKDHKPSESTDLTVGRVMPDVDWVIDRDNNLLERRSPNRAYRIGVFISDLHGKHYYGVSNPVEYAKLINKSDYDAVFMRYPLLYGMSYHPMVFWKHIEKENMEQPILCC